MSARKRPPGNLLRLRPPGITGVIPRPRLADKLAAVEASRVVLMVAPAGSGKTTAAAQWLHEVGHPFAWVSLDAHHDDLSTFTTVVSDALELGLQRAPRHLRLLLHATPPLVPETVSDALVADLAAADDPFILTLDDCHYLHSPPMLEMMRLAIRYLPDNVQLFLLSRRPLDFALTRLRLSNAIAELGAADLRFCLDEIQALAGRELGVVLGDEELNALEERTRGWAAGLRLALLGMQQGASPTEFLHRFSGRHRYVHQYFTEEVLKQEPPHIHSFLLHTCIADAVCEDLCAAVLPRDGTPRATLREVVQRGLFTFSRDDEDRWFSYHPLLRDSLATRLAQVEDPEAISALHSRAADWFAAHHRPEEAICHATIGGRRDLAVGMVAEQLPRCLADDDHHTLARWLGRFSPQDIENSIHLTFAQACVHARNGQPANLSAVLQKLESLPQKQRSILSRPPYLCHLARLKQEAAIWQGDWHTVLDLAQQMRSLAPFELSPTHICTGLGALALQRLGRLEEALRWLGDLRSTASADAIEFFDICDGLIRVAEADLPELQRLTSRLNEMAEHTARPRARLWSRFFGGLLCYESGRLPEALAEFRQGVELSVHGPAELRAECLVGLAVSHLGVGDLNAAEDAACALERENATLGSDSYALQLRWLRMRIALGRGQLAGGQVLPRPLNPPRFGMLPSVLLPHHLWARAAVLHGDEQDAGNALELLDQVQEAAEVVHDRRAGIGVKAVRALALVKLGQPEPAAAELQEALQHGAPGDFVRTFVDLGAPMKALLQTATLPATHRPRVEALLAAFTRHAPRKQPALLSEREVEVLELLATQLSRKEIAQHLHISVLTVRSHNYRIYKKLGVKTRKQALSEARRRQLLPPPQTEAGTNEG
ncbi:MAG: LuxR C-terminal-related transcriptional regulator [Armatimonadia bacterium]